MSRGMRWDAPWGYLPVEPGGPCLCPVAPRLARPSMAWCWVFGVLGAGFGLLALARSSRFKLLCLRLSLTVFLTVRSRFVIRSTHTICRWGSLCLVYTGSKLSSCLRAHARKKANSKFQLPGAEAGQEIGQCPRAKPRDPRASSNGSQLRAS